MKTFTSIEIGAIRLKNRIVRSATHEGLADEQGYPTEKLQKKHEVLAKNKVGCIITGFAGVMLNGKTNTYHMLMIHNDSYIEPYLKITEAVHAYQTPIILQITHCGSQTRSKATGMPVVAPSAVKNPAFPEEIPHELTELEIEEVIDHFVAAIGRAKATGFDGVQLHLAHGFLLSAFLSSYSNRRTDRWGGSTENKFRIVGEIFRKAHQQYGHYPILVKLNAYDGQNGGMRLPESILIAQLLEEASCAGIEVSCGVHADGLFTVRGRQLPLDALFTYSFSLKNYPNLLKKLGKPLIPLFVKEDKTL